MDMLTQERLREAQRLIQVGCRSEALALLKSILAADRTNVTAWWLAAQAAPNWQEAQVALHTALKLQPDHAGARAMLAHLEGKVQPAAPQPEPSSVGSDPFAPQLSPAGQAPVLHGAPLKVARRSGEQGCRRNAITLVIVALSLLVMSGAGLLLVLNLTGSPLLAQFNLPGAPMPDNPTPQVIEPGTPMQGTLAAGTTQEFRFQGREGAILMVAIQFLTLPADTDCSGAIVLIDPDGYRAAVSGDTNFLGATGGSVLEYTLDRTGIWRLRLIGQEGHSAGLYMLMFDLAE